MCGQAVTLCKRVANNKSKLRKYLDPNGRPTLSNLVSEFGGPTDESWYKFGSEVYLWGNCQSYDSVWKNNGIKMDYSAARRNMVENQVRTNRVVNPAIISALEELPRENFVPEAISEIAYVDEALPLADGRYLLEPMVLALLLQHAEIDPGDIVMEIAPGTGYSTAVLSKLASTVVAVEDDKELAETASTNLISLGIDNVAVMTGPLIDGYKKQAPYNVIIISGCVEEVPEKLFSQMAEGGKLLAVVGTRGVSGKGTVVRKFGKSISSSEVFEAGTPILPGFGRPAEFNL